VTQRQRLAVEREAQAVVMMYDYFHTICGASEREARRLVELYVIHATPASMRIMREAAEVL
jgi:hypothetical protein